MVQEGVDRRLAAILAADVVGYSRLMAADEEGTLAPLRALRAQRIDPAVAKHHGRMVKLMVRWSSSPASSTPSHARSTFSAAWPSTKRICRMAGAFGSGSASISAT